MSFCQIKFLRLLIITIHDFNIHIKLIKVPYSISLTVSIIHTITFCCILDILIGVQHDLTSVLFYIHQMATDVYSLSMCVLWNVYATVLTFQNGIIRMKWDHETETYVDINLLQEEIAENLFSSFQMLKVERKNIHLKSMISHYLLAFHDLDFGVYDPWNINYIIIVYLLTM